MPRMKSLSILFPVLALVLGSFITPAFAQGTSFPQVKIVIDPKYSMTVNGVEHFGAFTELHRDELVGIYRTESFLYVVDHTGMLSILAQLPKKDGKVGGVTLYQAAEGPALKSLYAGDGLKERYRAYIVDLQYPDQTILRQEFLFETSLSSPTTVFVIDPQWLSQPWERSLGSYSLDLDPTWGEGGYKPLTLGHQLKDGVSTYRSVVVEQPQSKNSKTYKYPHLLPYKRTPLVSYAPAWNEAFTEYQNTLDRLYGELKKGWESLDKDIHLQWDGIDLRSDDEEVRKTDHSFVEYLAFLKVRDKITKRQLENLIQALAYTAQVIDVEAYSGRRAEAVILSKWSDGRESPLRAGVLRRLKLGTCSIVGSHSQWMNDARNL